VNQLEFPFFYVVGNHDISNDFMRKDWEEKYGKRYYHFTYKNVLFLILDSTDDEVAGLSPAQVSYAQKALKDNPDVRWTFVLFHHPIWNWKGNRFVEVETAMSNRNYTVLAGHEHTYNYTVRNDRDYINLATTGGGSAMRGSAFGEFDHVMSMSMRDGQPTYANLAMKGIFEKDLYSIKSDPLSAAVAKNSSMENYLLCNAGDTFQEGTLALYFENPSPSTVQIDLEFLHHNHLQISETHKKITLAPNSKGKALFDISSISDLGYGQLENLRWRWKVQTVASGLKQELALEGIKSIPVKPSNTDLIFPQSTEFLETETVGFKVPDPEMKVWYQLSPSTAKHQYSKPITISQTSKLKYWIENEKKQISQTFTKTFRKVPFMKAVTLNTPEPGMKYRYYEGDWKTMPDFSQNTPLDSGVFDNGFNLSDTKKRENHFAFVMEGYLKVPEDRFFFIQTKAEDSSKLYLHGELVGDADQPDSKGQAQFGVALRKGYHPIRIEYLDISEEERFRMYQKLKWEDDWEFMEFENWLFIESSPAKK
ncbi:MAG TPA: PA14 domain-containing protein, partial [Algoriphagus sp.]|nr:PA14 domain-containing protein [Algoriphagus sp.]